jgi:hypothetical protein
MHYPVQVVLVTQEQFVPGSAELQYPALRLSAETHLGARPSPTRPAWLSDVADYK